MDRENRIRSVADKTNQTTAKGNPPKGWKRKFIQALSQTGNITFSARYAGVGCDTAYRHRRLNAKFARRWDDACEQSYDAMELEARRRAVQGTERPIYHVGKKVGAVKEFSDNLLMFMLKASRPEKFRENYAGPGAANASTPGYAATQGVPVTVVEVRIPHAASIPDATHEQRGIDGPAA